MLASTVPVVLYGEEARVAEALAELQRLAPGRETLRVDVWVRRGTGTTGSGTRTAVKQTLALYHGPGDIDRVRVCVRRLRCRLE